MPRARKRRFLSIAIALVALSGLAACTVSLPGGIVGGIMALLLTGSLLFGVGATQAGCDDDGVEACLSVTAPDGRVDACLSADIGPCLSQLVPDVGPCLQPPPPDGGDAHVGPCLSPPAPDAHVGPCLSPPAPDAGSKDAPVGPCLSIAPPDAGKDAHVGPCLSPPPPDAGPSKDIHVGPCLSIAPPDASPDVAAADVPPTKTPAMSREAERARLLARLDAEGKLPADVAERLKRRG